MADPTPKFDEQSWVRIVNDPADAPGTRFSVLGYRGITERRILRSFGWAYSVRLHNHRDVTMVFLAETDLAPALIDGRPVVAVYLSVGNAMSDAEWVAYTHPDNWCPLLARPWWAERERRRVEAAGS